MMRFFIFMAKFARSSKSTSSIIYDITPPFSFYDYSENKFKGLFSLRRLLSQVRTLGGNTLVEEIIEPSQDIIEENGDIEKRYHRSVSSVIIRLSFFTKKFKTNRGLRNINNDEFIGYIILKHDNIPTGNHNGFIRVYESVIKNSNHPNNCIRGKQKWKCNILGNIYEVEGYLYAQQNNMTNVCAHVALRTAAASFHSDGDMTYREMNDIVGIDHITKKAGGADGDGLTSIEMVNILESAGARCFVGDYTGLSNTPVPFQKYIYGSIESGFPSIVFFGTSTANTYHTIPIYGHTFNEDTWVPNADFSYFNIGETKYIPSESWLSMFIAHDDNWGSNYCIPRRYLNVRKNCTLDPTNPTKCQFDAEGVAYVISTIPREVKMNPIQAEVIGADFLFTILLQMTSAIPIWGERLRRNFASNMIVLRPVLVNANNYLTHLNNISDWENNKFNQRYINILRKYLTLSYYWLVELSLPDLFSANKRKVGEVLLRADDDPGTARDMKSFVLARLPGYIVFYETGNASSPIYTFIQTDMHSHCQLYNT